MIDFKSRAEEEPIVGKRVVLLLHDGRVCSGSFTEIGIFKLDPLVDRQVVLKEMVNFPGTKNRYWAYIEKA